MQSAGKAKLDIKVKMKISSLSVTLVIAMTGCTNFDKLALSDRPNGEIKSNQVLKSKWAGKQAEEFFSKLGPPANQLVNTTGQIVYLWSKQETLGAAGLFCDIRIVAESKGKITDIQVIAVTSGIKSYNYCDEISW